MLEYGWDTLRQGERKLNGSEDSTEFVGRKNEMNFLHWLQVYLIVIVHKTS